jgi:dienelactone hydrolase
MKWRKSFTSVVITVVTLGLLQAPLFSLAAQGQNISAEKSKATDNQMVMSTDYTKTAHAFIDCMARGDFEQSMSYLDDTMKKALAPNKLKEIWNQLNAAPGASKTSQNKRVFEDRQETTDGHTSVFVPSQFGSTILNLVLVFNGSDKVAGFFIQPHLEGAPYVKRDKFKEEDVKIGTGKWQTEGILSLPEGKGPFAAVILVHGSGPLDKDSTIGPNKPFQDLAHGLASQGVAVLRYEKRTKQHKAEISAADLRTFTVQEETIDDLVEAIKTLKNNSHIDSSNIYLLGHSLGGMLIPRIAGQDKSFKGFISLAGSNAPFEDAIVNQAEYLASQSPGEDATKELNALKKQSAHIRKLTESDAANGPLILGAYPAYYLDLRKHNPLAEVKNLDRPVLFLQGGRDYQVTTDDFTRWKAAVKDAGKDSLCQFKLYPELNHLFIAGVGKSTGKEYFEKPGHVDKRVIADIVQWIQKQSSSKNNTPTNQPALTN